MNRKHFIKTFATLAGGATLVSCSNDLISDLIEETENLESLSMEDAQKWFEQQYLPSFTKAVRLSGEGRKHKRKAVWEKAVKPENTSKKDYIWIPIDYEDDARPGVVFYDENTLFKKELSKYYLQPIIEGLIVVKNGKENKAFLAQIAYDMQALAANNFTIEKQKFTGTLLKADWDDNVINGVTYEKGKPIYGFKDSANEVKRNGRVAQCDYVFIGSYNTFYLDSNNEVVIVVHRTWASICDGSGSGSSNGGFSGFGGGDYGGGGSGSYYGDNYYDPLVHSNAGNITYIPEVYNFNLTKAIEAPGPDRMSMNASLQNSLYAVGLASGTAGFSWAKADAIAKSIGLSIDDITPTVQIFGKTFNIIGASLGIAGLATSAPSIYIGITDGHMSDEDWRAVASFGLGVAGLFATGWVAVAIGAVSIGIAIYDHP